MTKKDYVRIAAALRDARPAVIPGTAAIINADSAKAWHDAVYQVSAALGRDNDRFDATRFFDACGVAS